MMGPWRSAASGIVSVIMIMGGCRGAGARGDLADAVRAYDAGQYSDAHDAAVAVLGRANGGARDEAAYLAGLSAYRLKDHDEAERRFLTASESDNAEIVGRSKATLGLIRLHQNWPDAAADLLREASGALQGEESTHAARLAEMADRRPHSSSMRGELPAEAAPNGFAIQVGAFRSMENARVAAKEARTIARRHRLGSVRIIPRADDEYRTLYFVQFGRFDSRTAAERARSRIRADRYIVAPAVSTG